MLLSLYAGREVLSDAIVYDKLNLLKKDFFGYIERNTVKVDANLPVFYGYVISAVDASFPKLSDDVYDEFIDNITFKVLDVSSNSGDSEYIRKVIANAIRFKKKKDAEMGVNIVVGLKLLKTGDYVHALDYLKKYIALDAKIGAAVVNCYYSLSLREFRKDEDSSRNYRPGEMELLAREILLNLTRLRPPVNNLPQLQVDDPAFLEKTFWQMVFTGLEWFPSEKWFVEIGLKNAVFTGNADMRKRLLEIGSERFYSDIPFLREMFYYNLENRDAGGAAGVVNQWIKQYPDELEPIYLGLSFPSWQQKRIRTTVSGSLLLPSRCLPISLNCLIFHSICSITKRRKPQTASMISRLNIPISHTMPRFSGTCPMTFHQITT